MKKKKIISQICIHVIFSSVDSNMPSSFFVNDFDFIYEGKRCFAERANFYFRIFHFIWKTM